MTESLTKPYAVIYPLPKEMVFRILQDKKSTFVKYATHECISSKLQSCKKILFYVSHSHKEIVGEAEISSIHIENISGVLAEFSETLFLSENELRAYSNGRDEKKLMVFLLNNIKVYSKPVFLGHGITMVGEYISKEEYHSLISV